MNVMETTGASTAVRTSWVDTDVGAHKDLSSTTSGISVLMKTNAPILTCVALLLATTPWEVTGVSAHRGSPMTSSPMPATM